MAIPKISIVAVGRNDNYGGDFKTRLELFVNWTHKQLERNEIFSEIIFVNYNPVEGVPIEKFINWPKSTDKVRVRILTVSPLIHETMVNSLGIKNVPVVEYLAKNIGIRRAEGEFILAANPDILLSESLFPKLKNLSPSTYYRVNRLDYDGEFNPNSSKSLYSQLGQHVSAIWFSGSHSTVANFSMKTYYKKWFSKRLENLWRRNTVHLEKSLNYWSIPVYYHNIEYRYHLNASGDFMLMHRQAWHRLKGYKENSRIALHVDSLMVLQAAFSGLKEHVFLDPIYHRQHERRYDAIKKQSDDQTEVYEYYKRDAKQMNLNRKPIIYNTDDWGLAGIELHHSD